MASSWLLIKWLRREADISGIIIPPIIDHPAYRAMLSVLAEMKKQGSCIELATSTRRDGWRRYWNTKHMRCLYWPYWATCIHWSKIDWDFKKPSPYVARDTYVPELPSKNFPAVSGRKKRANSYNGLLPPDSVDAVNFINSSIISMFNAYEYKVLDDVVDRCFMGGQGR